MSVRRRLALGLAAVSVAVAGCGGSGTSSSSSRTASGARLGTAHPPAARFVLGRWRGELHERGVAPFLISVTVRSLARSAANSVHYTGINCGGHWTFLGTTGATVRFREVIDRGRSSACKGVGEVTLTRVGTRLRYRFSGGGIVSRGLLSRG